MLCLHTILYYKNNFYTNLNAKYFFEISNKDKTDMLK